MCYGFYKKYKWALTTTLILTTLSVVVYLIMLISFIVVLIKFQEIFSITGIITTVIALLINLVIVFLITRPATKKYFLTD
jgi:hypothetical protein